jgi:acyl-CoA thioesterase-1
MFRKFTYGVGRWLGNLSIALFFAAPALAQDRVDILAFGDSLTQGYGLIEQEGFVPQLRGWLADRGHDVRIVNGGVSGDTTAGGLARIDWSLTSDIDAMIVTLGGNDLLRGIDPDAVRANMRGILEAAEEQDVAVLVVGMSAPGNYGPEYKAEFDAVYPDLAAEFGTLYFESFFKGLSNEASDLGSAREFMQPDGIHPNGEGVARIVDSLGPAVELLIQRALSKG